MGNHNQSQHAAANPPPSEANQIAANNEEPTELQNDANYFADAGSADFDSDDVA